MSLPAVAVALSLVAGTPGDFDLRAHLRPAGVRLVAVDLYASWCRPCVDALPRWKSLLEKQHRRGLRLVTIVTQDPGSCRADLGFTPDAVICDSDGRIFDSLGRGRRLPASFLWSWQGRLLVREGHTDDVAAAAERWMRESHRVHVDANDDALKDLVREALIDTNKIDVVASKEEQERIDELRAMTYDGRYDEKARTEVGKDLPPNHLLEAKVSGSGKQSALAISLFSIETGWLVATSALPWNGKNPRAAVREAVVALLDKIGVEPELPDDVAAPVPRPPEEPPAPSVAPAAPVAPVPPGAHPKARAKLKAPGGRPRVLALDVANAAWLPPADLARLSRAARVGVVGRYVVVHGGTAKPVCTDSCARRVAESGSGQFVLSSRVSRRSSSSLLVELTLADDSGIRRGTASARGATIAELEDDLALAVRRLVETLQ